MAIIAKYKFNPSLCADYLPVFNNEFTGYTKTDVNNSDGTITRTISHSTLKPTYMRFGSTGAETNREKSFLEVIECDTSQVINMNNMFQGCQALTSLDLSNFNTSNVTTMVGMFYGCKVLTSLNISSFDTSQVINMNTMFRDCFNLTSLDVSSFDTSKVTNMQYMFSGCNKLTSLDVSSFNTSNVTNMIYMFNRCSSLTSLDLSSFDTSKVNNMNGLFIGCQKITSLNLSNFDTSSVTNMVGMFQDCSSLTSLDLSSFNTSKATGMSYMFSYCSSLTSLDVSSFDTSKVTNMADMFHDCSSLTSLDLSNFNTNMVSGMNGMFYGCSSLTLLDLSSFNTSQVQYMNYMFYGCSSLTLLDLSSFNTGQVTNTSYMFIGCSSLTSLDLSNFNTSKVTNMQGMFNNCLASDIGLLYATSATINNLLTELGTSTARNIYYTDAPLNELTVQDNITYKKYELTMATFPYTLNKLPNGVADYVDVVNKVHVQRVGKIVLDGSDDENWILYNRDYTDWTTHQWRYTLPFVSSGFAYAVDATKTMCDKLKYGVYADGILQDYEHYRSNGQNANGISEYLYIWLDKTKATDVSSLKTYLQSNPITVLYELKAPIYTPLTEEEIAQLPLSAYKDGYVMLSSDQLMPSFEFRMRASNRYQVDMLETGYYYLNAPVGNVKLGTANVDVQQMPCIVKVDNVGTGDSGYRLGIGGYTSFLSLDKSTVTLGYYYDASGELKASGRDCVYEEYIPISNGDSILINQLSETSANLYIVAVLLYDSNKNMIKRFGLNKDRIQKINANNVAYFRFSCIHNMNITEPTTKVAEVYINPITLAKLPSHRIPKSFTQGMRCGTNFGYWEGIKEAQTYGVQTANKTTIGGFGTIELYGIEIGGSFIEDEFDISIGKLTKRIGVKKLVGIEDWKVVGSVLENSVLFQLSMDGVMAEANTSTNYVFNDKYPRKTGDRLWSTETYGVGGNTDVIRIRLNLPYRTVDEFKRFLSLNPITVYYRLRVPEIAYLTPQFSQMEATNSSTRINVLKNSANNKLFPQCKPSHLTYPVPSLVGNREYTVVHNRKNITGSTKPIELNLGGTVVQLNDASSKTLVKTPSTLAHSNLIFIGGESTVDHIMVLDGDWTNKPIEYFENMKGHDTDAIITIIGDGKIDDVAERYLW